MIIYVTVYINHTSRHPPTNNSRFDPLHICSVVVDTARRAPIELVYIHHHDPLQQS
jgi:hypothetical protein